MARYESLKDYLSLNRKDEILKKVNEYIQADSNVESNCFLKDFTIITVRCVEEIFPTAMVFMDVSAEVYNNNNTSVPSVYYSISFSGNVLTGFSGLNLIFTAEISENELHEENIPAMFCLPDISIDTIEEEAQRLNRILCTLIKKDPEHKYWFDPVKVKEKYKLKMWPAELNNGILGQIRFTPSRADIYDIRDMSKCFLNEPIPENSILINSDYYKEHSKRYDDIIVATHELVHWNLHKMYFNIMQLLEGDFNHMSCSSEPIVFEDSMSLKDKAYWYAEWQANELAMRVAMPKHLIKEAIDEYENSISESHRVINSSLPHDGFYYKIMIQRFSWWFNVPSGLLRKRFRQLGYDFADGFRFDDEDDYSVFPSLSFVHGSLKENETFIIDCNNYERLMTDNKEFAELINDKICVYTGYVVCINNPKYIRYSINNDKIEYDLSRYAIDHADECCLIFELYDDTPTPTMTYSYYNQAYLCCLIEKYKDKEYNQTRNVTVFEQQQRMVLWLKNDKELYDQIIKEGITTFSEVLSYIMDNVIKLPEDSEKRKKLIKKDLAEFIGCDDKTIQNYRNGDFPDTIEKAMLICLALETGPKVSKMLIEKSVGGIPDVGYKKIAYEFLLYNTHLPLDEWNRILENDFDLPPIKFK
ncbi:MAG: hypothetical protein IKH75_07510 [Ruminococcus sp.]|nr:hypothetical protein [Ruminococcus sp.]